MPYTKQSPYCVISAIVVPISYVVSPNDKDADRLCEEFTKYELTHVSLIDIPVRIEHTGAVAVGYVVDQSWHDDIGLVVKIEIPMVDSVTMPEGRQLMNTKQLVTTGIELGKMCDVSISHSIILMRSSTDKLWHATKCIREISLVVSGAKDGSNILGVSWSTIPYSINKRYKTYTGNMSDYTAFTSITLPSKPSRIKEPQLKHVPIVVRSKNMSAANNQPAQGQTQQQTQQQQSAPPTTAVATTPGAAAVPMTPAEQYAFMEQRMKEMEANMQLMKQQQQAAEQKAAEFDKLQQKNNQEAVKQIETVGKSAYALADTLVPYLSEEEKGLADELKKSNTSFDDSIKALQESINGRDTFNASDLQNLAQNLVLPVVACSRALKNKDKQVALNKPSDSSSNANNNNNNNNNNASSSATQPQTIVTTTTMTTTASGLHPPVLPSKPMQGNASSVLTPPTNLLFKPLDLGGMKRTWENMLADKPVSS